MRPFKFLCKTCARSKTNQPGYTICERCVEDDKNLNKLGDMVRAIAPQNERTPSVVILAKLWVAYLKKCKPNEVTALKTAEAFLKRVREGEQLQLLR